MEIVRNQYTLEGLTDLIRQWSFDRGLETANPQKQGLKLGEESGELHGAVAKDKEDRELVIRDSIGDIFVVVTVLSTQLKIDNFKDLVIKSKERVHEQLYAPGMSSRETRADETVPVLDIGYRVGLLEWALLWQDKEQGDLSISDIEFCMVEVLRSLFRFCILSEYSIVECVTDAYNEIKDRKGKMIDGVFVKEADIK